MPILLAVRRAASICCQHTFRAALILSSHFPPHISVQVLHHHSHQSLNVHHPSAMVEGHILLTSHLTIIIKLCPPLISFFPVCHVSVSIWTNSLTSEPLGCHQGLGSCSWRDFHVNPRLLILWLKGTVKHIWTSRSMVLTFQHMVVSPKSLLKQYDRPHS